LEFRLQAVFGKRRPPEGGTPTKQTVAAETDLHRRGDYSLAIVVAEKVNRRAVWHNAMEGFSMIESPIIAELLSEHGGKIALQAKVKATVELLLRTLRKRHGELPDELTVTIRACQDGEQLDRWFDTALEAETLAEFRQQTGV
jgi:hypothetical protein